MSERREEFRYCYDLNGTVLAVEAAAARAASFLEGLLGPLRAAPESAAGWTARLAQVGEEAIARPPDGPFIFDEPLPEGLPAVLVAEGAGRRFVVPGHFDMLFDRAARTTSIRYAAGRERGLSGTACFWLLTDLVTANGQHLLHGASLVDPSSGQAIAMFAPSGTGKSTTTLALARAGVAVTGDDVMVLDAGSAPARIWGVPRAFKVHRRTAAMLPWLAPILHDAWKEDEQAIPYRLLRALVPVVPPLARPVGLVVVLMPPNGEGHRLRRMSKPEALAAIAGDNVRIAPGGVDADNAATLAAVARLITATPVVSLSVGPDPGSLSPELFAKL